MTTLIDKLISQLPPTATVAETHPLTQDADAEIVLGGAYDGCRIQVGRNYYVVAAEDGNDGIVQIDGKGDLCSELNAVIGAQSL
jgi:uncharacterized membrane-anchored protein